MSVNKDQVKKLYDATSQDYGLTNFELFVQSLNDDVKRKEFFDLANVKYDIGNTLEEFENNLGIKKKILAEEPIQPNLDKPLIKQEEPKAGGATLPQQSRVSLEPTVPSPSVSPLVSEPLKALRGADQTKISVRAKELGLDSQALTAAINDFEGDDDVIVNKAKEFATNRAEYDKSKAAYTWRNMLKTTMKNSGVSDDEANIKIDYVTKLQQLDIDPQTGQTIPAGYAGSLERVSKIRDVIKENITNEGDRQEALRALNVDAYAALYQGMKDQNAVNGWAKTGNGNVFVGAGLDMLRLTDPDRAKTLAERIQNQYATNEDKALYLRELENIGLNAIAFEVNRNLNRVSQSDKKPSETFVSALNNWKSLAEKTKASQINRYGDITGADIDRMLFDVTEGLETSTGEKAIYNVAAGASDWLERGLSGIWDYATKNREERLASDMKRDHSKYITEELLNYADTGSSMREAAFIPKLVDPEIKKQVEEVMANTSLDRDEKYKSVYPLIKNAYLNGGIEFFSNPNKGNLNLTSKNILHLVSTSGARSIGNVIPAVMTGGGASTALIAGLDAAAMKYDEQFREGSNDPLARSLRTGLTVGALAGIMDEAAALSKAFKGGSASLVAKPTALGTVKSFGTMLGKEEVEELATEALDGDVVKNWKEVVLSTAIIAPIFAGPTAIIDNRRSSDMYRQLWFEAGASPELAKNGLNRMLNEGAINNTQFNEASKRVDRMAQIVANMPKTDMKGQPLSDSQKAKYADNLMKKYDAQSIPDTLPTKVAEQIAADAQQADAENASILEGEVATDLSITEDKTTEQISKQDQIKQKNEFITDADFVQEAFTPEEDAADREALPESQFKTEEELSDFLANGQYAMLTGQNPEATPLSKDANRKLNEKAQQWLSSRGLTAVPIFGKYGNSERSFMVPNMTKRQAVEFAKEFQQESVAHSSGLVYQDGSFNPRTEGVDLSPRFDQGGDFFSTINVGGKKVDFSINYDFDTKVEPKKALYESLRKRMFGDVGQKVASAQKALEKTGVVINMVQDPAEFDRTVAKFGGQKGVEGVFVSDQGKIFINQTKLDQGIADGRVIWHESSHPVVNIIRNTNRQLFDKVVSGLKQASQNNKGVMDALTWAETNYAQDGQGVVDDEAVVETIAGIAEGTIDIQALPTGVKQSIIEFINRIATALGFDPVLNDTDVAAFKKLASDVANALSTGQDISEIVGAENVKDYLNTVEAPGIVTGGELNKATQSRVTAEPAVNVYASKEVSALPQKSLTEIYEQFGGKAVVINSDPTRVGTLTLPSGKTIFMYGGPAYLSVKDNVDGNVGFATTQISKVNTWMNYVKEVFGDQPGVTLVASQAPTSILSNSYALRYVMDGISQLPKSVLKSSDFKNEFFGKDLVLLKDAFGDKAYNEFVNKYKKADLSNPEVIDAMIAEMAYKVGDDNKPASFKARGAFVSNLLGGLAEKASLKGVEGDKGYVSKKPNKFIAKQLMDRLGINAEKVMREIGEPSLVEQYMNEGNWGFAVAGFETDPSLTVESVQNGGVKHPLFNAKFPGKSPFILDGAYDLDQMFTPVEMTGPSGMPYTKTASQMLAGSMYVKGQPISGQGSFEYKNVSPSGRRIQSSKGNRVTRAMDNVSNQMTEDGQGNYVFYHYSNNDLKKIDPSKFGRNIATGRDERPGVGLSMYYTRPDIMEANVPSEFGYVVRIPKNKVYPFNDDPLNLLPEAEKQFKKQFPDQAFDFNKQVGFVTKVAADRGYPMTVAEWNVGRKKALRAQTTESMKPEKFKENVFEDGYLQEKINPKLDFVPNAKKRAQMSKGNRISTDTQIIDGFYSPIENRVNDFKQPKASATKWKEIVGVKSDEAVFSGLSDWLNSQKPDAQLSKQDVLNFMKGNRIQIKEVTKRDTRTDATKYSQYQLPGGENYKEVLITLPTVSAKKVESLNAELDQLMGIPSDRRTAEETKRMNSLLDALSDTNKKTFTSSHFDEPNIITHLRMNTRTDADGKKVLFLEEVQSDWGQKGKREGFKVDKKEIQPQLDKVDKELRDKYGVHTITGGANYYGFEVYKDGKWVRVDESDTVNVPESKARELISSYKELMEKLPPYSNANVGKAPFVTNTNAWVKLGLKYALKEAVRQGADRIAWTTGEQQNERYNLSNVINNITAVKSILPGAKAATYSITSEYKTGEKTTGTYNENQLPDVIGKDLADKVIADGGGTYSGLDLQVGGKGMKAFYGDAQNPGIVANVAKALVKELTGKEGEVVPSKISSQRNQDVIDRYNRARQYGNIPEALAKEYEQAQGLDSEQPAIEITPALRQEVKAGMPQFSMGNRDNEIRQFIRENIGQYSPDEISQAIQDELGISKADADAMVADESKGQAPLAEEIQTFQAGTGEEQERAMADQFEGLAPEVESQIDEDARTYFAKTNKQTDEEVDNFIKGKDMADLADYVVSNPNIPGRVKIWMAAKVAKNLGRDIEAARANGDQAEVARLSEKQANIYNTFAREATELGQAVQAFVAFNDDPNAVNFFLNKILRQLKENGVESITDQQRNDLIGLMQAVNNARPGLPKNKAIIQLSHYLGRLAPVKIGDVLQSIWYAHILSGVTTQLKNIYANTTMLALELPIGATWQSMKNRSLMPFVYAFKGLGAGLAKGIVKGADILRSGVTDKDANKFFGTEPVLEYFSWKQTKLGKLGGGAVGKFLDFPLFIGISPKTLKMVGRALAGADAFFSTTAQEAMANMLAYNQAVAEGKSGITPNGYRRVQELLGNTKQTIQDSEATAVSEGFKPGTIEYKRRVIELVTETRDKDNKVAADEFGKRVTLTNEPEGFTRGIYQVATAIQQYMPISRVVIPFTRIVSNISEMIINYSPAGAYRALTGIKNPKLSFKFSPTGDNKLSDEARGELFLKSSMAIAAVALLMDNVGDDEEDWFDITGGGPTDFQKKYELMKGGWRPYTITLKNGKKINYADWPIAGALSGLGTMRDIQQYEKEDVKKNESRLGLAAYGYLTAFYDKSLIKGISDFVDLFRLKGKYGPDATSLEKFEKFMANQAKALSMTNFSQQVFKMIQEYNDDPIKEAKGWESLYRDLPVLNDGLNPIIDVFGDPVTPSTSERLLPYMTVKDEKKDAMIEMINKKGIFIGIPEQKPFVELDTRTEREMTRDELYRYRKMAGEYTKAILLNRIDDISKAADKYEGEFKQKAWEKMIGNAVSAARKRAYVDLLMNKKTDINKLFEDLNQE